MYRFGLIVCVALLFSCRTAQVEVLDRHQDFSLVQYSSFRFIENDGEAFSRDYREKINFLKDQIVRQMEARGLTHDRENPELLVNIGIAVEDRVQTRQTGLVTDPGTFNYIGQRRYTWKSETVEVGRYQQGTMTIHLVDPVMGEAVWMGTVEKVLPRGAGHLQETVIRGVEKLFKQIDRD
ncbi:DUF4136 domain-containing protein [Litoribacter ruber]|uniref:DUF4136 domain-containing protein n=1 Tax=Litoribacter ruber TaxID=702568 RepID=A0AAP2CH47_9BACT|nr:MULTISPECIES: DUF4136 domain-containing protein [Litoribacter]MBS9523121.1 DUF4136 domain-containing protein [Litoribacter alkaliphilus]MBT0810716.1 DUF4136 domain-containing protein [Litoribacter ruber]